MHVLIMKKSTAIKIIAFAALFLGVFFVQKYIAGDTAAVMAQREDELSPICAVDTTDKTIALTVDTAFGNDRTAEILGILKEHNVKATFCVTGSWASENQELMKSIVADGHEIVSHSMSHQQYTDMTAEDVVADANAAKECLKQYTGKECSIIRPPYGAYNEEVMAALDNAGYTVIKWSVDAEDWSTDDTTVIYNNVISNAVGGDIVMIQNNTNAASALNDILTAFSDNGYTVCTLSSLLPEGAFEVDTDGTVVLKEGEQEDAER